MKTFIALEFDAPLKRKLGGLQRVFKKHATEGSWVYVDNYHITLKFLGTTNPEKVDDMKSMLGRIASNYNPISLKFKDLGFFPMPNKLRVLFMEVEGDIDDLNALQKEVDLELNGLGFPKEKRKFLPHITLGRNIVFSTTMHKVKDIIRKDLNYAFKLKTITLMKSDLEDGKRIYTPLAKYDLHKS